MKKIILVSALAFTVSACAKGPDSIAPVSMNGAYDGISCSAANKMLTEERARYNALASKQKGAVAGDAIGVFLIGVPVSSLTGGDAEGQIAESKGKIIALETRLLSC